jgi:hypothetical protein
VDDFQVGQILTHSEMPEIGRLKVERSSKDQVEVLVERKCGGETKKFRLPNAFLHLSQDQDSSGFEAAKAPKKPGARRAPASPKAVRSFEEAHSVFLAKYPGGFSDPKFLKAERASKESLLAAWKTRFSPEAIQAAKATGDPAAFSQGFQEIFKIAPLMHPAGEWLPFLAAIRENPEIFTLANLYAETTAAGAFTQESFDATVRSFETLGLARPKWTLFTYWPYIGAASGFPFVKPTLIRAAALGLGIELGYEPFANWATYCKALAVYEELWKRLQPSGARDWVDVQAFLGVGWKG